MASPANAGRQSPESWSTGENTRVYGGVSGRQIPYAAEMPVIVIGADTATGRRVVEALRGREGEVRVFVTDPADAKKFKVLGTKVAIGDVSDGSHIGDAALNCFGAVALAASARDDRERSFAASPGAVYDAWAEGLGDAGVQRVIWVGDAIPSSITSVVAESISVPDDDGAPSRVRELDDLPRL